MYCIRGLVWFGLGQNKTRKMAVSVGDGGRSPHMTVERVNQNIGDWVTCRVVVARGLNDDK